MSPFERRIGKMSKESIRKVLTVLHFADLIVKRGYITPYEDFLIKSAFLKMAEVSAVVAIPGNHDMSNRFDRVDAVTGILMREDQGVIRAIHPRIKASGRWEVFDLKMGGGFLRIFTLPHPSKYLYLAAKKNEVGNHLDSVISEKVKQLMLGMMVVTEDDMSTILVGHGTITGGVTESEMVMTTENDISIDREWLPDCSAIMYGHLHKPQTVGKAIYSGSLAPLTFGSEKHNPSYVLWEIPVDGSNVTFERIPIPVAHQLLTIDIPEDEFSDPEILTEEGCGKDEFTPMDVIKRRLQEKDVEGAMVRLRYRIPEDLASLVDKAEVQRFLDQLRVFEYRIVCESVSPIKVRAEEIDPDLSFQAMLKSWTGLDPLRKEMLKEIKVVAREVDNQILKKEHHKFVGSDYRITRIKAQNFKPLVDIDIEFNKLGKIVCISGENHNGKSQLAEVERFAFWKVLRRGTVLSDAIRLGTDQCNVSVWFTAEGNDYRVDRSVKRDGKGNAKSDVVFCIKENEEYRSLNEGHVNQTHEAIEQVVGSYSMYRTTRFGSQKEISLLVNMLPSEMKDTLQEAINVGVFDIRKQVANTLLEDLKKRWDNQNIRIVHLEREVESKQELEAEFEVTREKKKDVEKQIRKLKRLLEEIKAELLEAEKASQQLSKLDASKVRLDSAIDDTVKKLERKLKIASNRKKVEAGVRRTKHLRKLLEAMSEKQVRYRELEVKFTRRKTELIQRQGEAREKESELGGKLQRKEFELKKLNEKHERRVKELTIRKKDLQDRSKLVGEVPCVGNEMNDV